MCQDLEQSRFCLETTFPGKCRGGRILCHDLEQSRFCLETTSPIQLVEAMG